MTTEKIELGEIDADEMSVDEKSEDSTTSNDAVVDYSVEDVPPLPTAIFLGLQVTDFKLLTVNIISEKIGSKQCIKEKVIYSHPFNVK